MTKDKARQFVIENVFTVNQAAEYLGMTRGGIWRAASAGGLKQLPNGLYLRQDLDEYSATVKTGRPRKGTKRKSQKTVTNDNE